MIGGVAGELMCRQALEEGCVARLSILNQPISGLPRQSRGAVVGGRGAEKVEAEWVWGHQGNSGQRQRQARLDSLTPGRDAATNLLWTKHTSWLLLLLQLHMQVCVLVV